MPKFNMTTKFYHEKTFVVAVCDIPKFHKYRFRYLREWEETYRLPLFSVKTGKQTRIKCKFRKEV